MIDNDIYYLKKQVTAFGTQFVQDDDFCIPDAITETLKPLFKYFRDNNCLPTQLEMDYNNYKENYYNSNGKLVDYFQKTISLVPCNSTTSSKYDKTCGIKGVSGEFFRKISGSNQKPIVDFDAGVVNPVMDFLAEEASMPEASINEFVKVLKDIFYSDGSFSVINSSFIKYVPLYSSYINKTVANKYIDGQKKIANFLLYE